MADERIKYLFDRYIARTCTPAEKQELAVLGLMPENQAAIDSLFKEHWEQTNLDETMPEEKVFFILASILGKQISEKTKPATIIQLHWKKLAVAASILLVTGLGGYFLFFNKAGKQKEVVKTEPVRDVEAPKITKAMITLADGRTISIDSITSGLLAQQSKVTVTKTTDGKIVYAGNASEVVYNTLTNPRGSKVIDMALADGSHVWLNAGSSVTYPIGFIGNERKVSITGEAYFEIAHDASKPFFVSKGDMSVQVLGTHFNVNVYDDEETIKVTLSEGSVKTTIGNGQLAMLKPGEQAAISNGQLVINKDVDMEQVMAWKNGKFDFGEGTSLNEIMRQIARWYDVDIVYEKNVNETFWGSISRQVNVSEVLEKFELTGRVHFKIEGKKVIVSK